MQHSRLILMSPCNGVTIGLQLARRWSGTKLQSTGMIIFCVSCRPRFYFSEFCEAKNQLHLMLCHLFGSIVVQDVF